MSDFLTTQWSLIALASGPGEESHAALSRLCEGYWPPLFAYALRRGLDREDARDVTQDFFAGLLEKGWLGRVDAERGKFRSFLLTVMQRQVDSFFRNRMALKRGGGVVLVSMDDDRVNQESAQVLEGGSNLSPEEAFDLRWALEVLARAVERLRVEAVAAGREALFGQLRPFLSEEAGPGGYDEPARQLGMTANAFSQAVMRLRRRYGGAVRAEIAETVLKADMVEEEMKVLIGALRYAER